VASQNIEREMFWLDGEKERFLRRWTENAKRAHCKGGELKWLRNGKSGIEEIYMFEEGAL